MPDNELQSADLINTGISALVENAKRLGLTWTLRPATVGQDNLDGGRVVAVFDGDTERLTMTSLVGALLENDRVYVMIIPPSGNYIVGHAGNPSVLRLTSVTDASATSTNHALQIGPTEGQNTRMDANEISSFNNGANATLNFQPDGGLVQINATTEDQGLLVNGDVELDSASTGRFWRNNRSPFDTTNTPGISVTNNPSYEVARDGVCQHINHIATGAASVTAVQYRRQGTVVGSITVTATNTAYNTSSDYRLKEDDKPIVRALERLKKLRPVSFKWKKSETEDEGFLAHEVQELLPHVVVGEKDGVAGEKKDVDDPEPGTMIPQMLDYSKLVPLLCAAIQELAAKVETLEANGTGTVKTDDST